nr:MAG TPA: hypothetical protein [Caudoviricetes sp.]
MLHEVVEVVENQFLRIILPVYWRGRKYIREVYRIF